MKLYRRSFLLVAFLPLLMSCYRMPTEDEYSLVPMTNNPDVTKQRGESATPQMSY